MRKHNVDEINLTIDDIKMSEYYIFFSWSSDIGYGQYSIFYDKETGKWSADTEYMDSDEDKAFGRKLFELLMDKVKID